MSSGNFDGDSLQIYFKRIVNLEKDKKAELANFNEDIGAVYGEAKEAGFSPKILRGIVAEHLRPQPSQEDRDLEAIYRDALGLGGTPLDEAAKAQQEQREKDQATAEALEAADRAAMKPKGKGGKKKQETIDPETGEITEAQEAGSAERATGKAGIKPGRVSPEDLPEDPLEAAKVIALQASFGKIETRALDPDLGHIEVVKSKSAVGAVGEEMDDVHFALLEAGYHHVKGNTYAVPEHATTYAVPVHATEGV
jgi:uncharacterized protein (UPF0335 family)